MRMCFSKRLITESHPFVCTPPPTPHHTYPSYVVPSTLHFYSVPPRVHPIHQATHHQPCQGQGKSNLQLRHHQTHPRMYLSSNPSLSCATSLGRENGLGVDLSTLSDVCVVNRLSIAFVTGLGIILVNRLSLSTVLVRGLSTALVILSGNRIVNQTGVANGGGDGGGGDARVEEARISSALGGGVGKAADTGFEELVVRTGVEVGSMVVEAWEGLLLEEDSLGVAVEGSLEEGGAVCSLCHRGSLALRGRLKRVLDIAGAEGWS
ncbi:hypothetical protein N431DRAFT_430461 [Stipitochalara longipes BDJ]|nr:hypothetical protein N431DRAFT_430461 [Stipitochalara longipes BDJ]